MFEYNMLTKMQSFVYFAIAELRLHKPGTVKPLLFTCPRLPESGFQTTRKFLRGGE